MKTRAHVHIGGTTLFGNTHVCAFVDSREEEYRVLLPFIKEGFDRGEKAFHVVSPIGREDHLRRLRSVGSTFVAQRTADSASSVTGKRCTSRTDSTCSG